MLGPEPSDEQLAMAGGDAECARAFRELMNAHLVSHAALAHTTVALRNGRIVGLLQAGSEIGDRVTFALVANIVRVFGLACSRSYDAIDCARGYTSRRRRVRFTSRSCMSVAIAATAATAAY